MASRNEEVKWERERKRGSWRKRERERESERVRTYTHEYERADMPVHMSSCRHLNSKLLTSYL